MRDVCKLCDSLPSGTRVVVVFLFRRVGDCNSTHPFHSSRAAQTKQKKRLAGGKCEDLCSYAQRLTILHWWQLRPVRLPALPAADMAGVHCIGDGGPKHEKDIQASKNSCTTTRLGLHGDERGQVVL